MALRRISHKHTEEQVDRGYDILTNGEMLNSLNMIKSDQQEYLKKPAQTWSNIAALAQPKSAHSSKPASKASASAPQDELSRTHFGDRASRVGFGQNAAASACHQSQAPSSKRSEIRSGGFQKLGAQLAQ